MKWLRKIFSSGTKTETPASGSAVTRFEGYGGSVEEPVRCGGSVAGERAYLQRLRCPDGNTVRFSRKGSYQSDPNMVDGYLVECLCEKDRILVFMDMYDEADDRPIAAPGWTLAPVEAAPADADEPGRAVSESDGDVLTRKIKEHPEAEKVIQDGISRFGDDPVPKILAMIEAEGFTAEGQAMGAIWLSYIGKSAVPHLMSVLGNPNQKLATFAAKALAGIEGSLDHVREALRSDDARTRLHAAGSLQFFGPKATEAISDLCELVTREIAEMGPSEPGKVTEAAGVAAGALGTMGEAALVPVGGLLNDDNVNVRLIAVAAFLRIGKPALSLLRERVDQEPDDLMRAALQKTIATITEGE